MTEFLITKADEDQRVVFGFASMSLTSEGQPIVDSQDDVIEPSELEKAAYDYVLRSRDGGVMHERMGIARLIESFVSTPQKLKALGLAEDALPQGWWIGMKIDDADVWKRVKSGELKAFSIGGKATRVEVK